MPGFFWIVWIGLAFALGYIAKYSYSCGFGNYYIVIDSDKYDGCVVRWPLKYFSIGYRAN